jgi:hypothetical protein
MALFSSHSLNNFTMAHRLDIVDGISDDMSIAQGLLRRPSIPSRGTSFMGPSGNRLSANGSNGLTRSSEGNGVSERRWHMQSSNTWTSSSGDVLSDQDDIEDRGSFIQEYNRLARKVIPVLDDIIKFDILFSMAFDS